MTIRLLTISLILLCSVAKAQVPAPAPMQSKSILLMNGTSHIGNGNVIENSVVGFVNGKLEVVADATTIKLDMSKWDTVISVEGKHLYPGFISPNSTLGLQEIGAVRATRDQRDIGEFLPHVRSLIAYNTDSKIIPTVRSNGVLLAQITPRGGSISGTSSIVQLDGWNWEDAAYKTDDGIHLNWPRMFKNTGWWAEPGKTEREKKAKEKLERVHTFFKNAQAYNQKDMHLEKNLYYEAMRGLWKGTSTLFIHANYVKEIIQAVEFVREMGIKNTVLVGGYDSYLVTDLLKENNIAVMLRRVHSLPMRPEDDVHLPYKLPALLQKAGVLYCLQNAGDMEQMNTRNLPFYAGTAAAYGLTKEEALKAITLNPARILGIDKRTGTLEVGKEANLVVSTGDALDVRTNNMVLAFIQGRQVNLNNHQKDLYRKFKAKYSSQK